MNSKIVSRSLRELLGLSKGAYGSLNKFQRAALQDYEKWVSTQSKADKFLFDGKRYVWRDIAKPGDIPGVRHMIQSGPKRTLDGLITMPDGKKVFLPSSGKILPGYGVTPSNGGKAGWGTLSATPYENGTMNVILTPPGVEYKQETGKVLDELGNVIPKEDMRTFWSTIREIVRPGTYLSGDFASAPLGSFMKNQGSRRGAVKVLLEDAADKGLHKSGLSPDSYAAIVRQGARDGNALRFSRNAFTELNNTAVHNKDLYDMWKAAVSPQQKAAFVDVWNKRIYPGSARVGQSGQVEFLQPFVLYQKRGGNIFRK